ncbi:MAG: acyltransferase family protein [Treponema sp.]|jgi:hypothetical protein|nr:acyltransferase family protein [Treponema sp.]
MKTVINSDRIVFLDNIRSLIIILVLIFHSGASYGTGVEFWPFHDNNPSGVIDFFMFLCDVFFMAILFFIAGYFVPADLLKKGLPGFIKSKVNRLGFPWLIITVLALPVLDYIHYLVNHIKQSLPTAGFVEYWLLCMKKVSDFYIGWMDMSAYHYMTNSFYQRYMWFISLLLFFFILFALGYTLKSRLTKQNRQKSNTIDSRPDIVKIVSITSILMVVLFGITRLVIYPEFMGNGWFSLGNIIQFQFGKIVIYGCCFGLGIRAFCGKWFASNNSIGKPWAWAIVCFCLFGLNMLALKNVGSSEEPALIAKIAFCVFYPLWTLSFLGLFVSFAYRYRNKPTKFNMSLANNSYNMYLVHYIIPFTFPLILSGISMPTLVKFTIVSVVTLFFSYSFSVFIMKPISKIIRKKLYNRGRANFA